MHREPPASLTVSLCAERIKRQRFDLFIAGRKEAGDPEWRYYRPAGSPPLARRPFTEDEPEAA